MALVRTVAAYTLPLQGRDATHEGPAARLGVTLDKYLGWDSHVLTRKKIQRCPLQTVHVRHQTTTELQGRGQNRAKGKTEGSRTGRAERRKGRAKGVQEAGHSGE